MFALSEINRELGAGHIIAHGSTFDKHRGAALLALLRFSRERRVLVLDFGPMRQGRDRITKNPQVEFPKARAKHVRVALFNGSTGQFVVNHCGGQNLLGRIMMAARAHVAKASAAASAKAK